MSSPSQRRGSCGHMMAGFDLHGVCARCRDKKKGKDPCVEKPEADCPICNSFTPEQLTQLSTPTYKNKKEKREQKSSTPAKNPSDVALSPTLVDPSLVTVMGVVDGQPASGPSDLSEKPAEKKKKKEDKKVSSSKPVKSSHRPSAESTDQKLEVMEQKWSDRFNRLEALLLAKTLDREPTFSTVKVAPTHAPPATAISSEPFIRPPGLPSSSSQPPAASMSPAPLLVCLPPRPDLTLLSLPTDQGLQRQPTNLLRGRSLLPLTLEGIPRPVSRTLIVLVQIDLLLICTQKRVNFLMTRKCH